jgi:hypothetical protein
MKRGLLHATILFCAIATPTRSLAQTTPTPTRSSARTDRKAIASDKAVTYSPIAAVKHGKELLELLDEKVEVSGKTLQMNDLGVYTPLAGVQIAVCQGSVKLLNETSSTDGTFRFPVDPGFPVTVAFSGPSDPNTHFKPVTVNDLASDPNESEQSHLVVVLETIPQAQARYGLPMVMQDLRSLDMLLKRLKASESDRTKIFVGVPKELQEASMRDRTIRYEEPTFKAPDKSSESPGGSQ